MKTFFLLLNLVILTISGRAQWTSTGIDVSTLKNIATKRVSLRDGNYGSIVCFTTCDSIFNDITYFNAQIYAQKISATGVLQWGTANSPKPVCIMPNNQVLTDAVEDGNGGAYLAWDDYRSGSGKADVYIQHINSSGTSIWMENGIKVSNNTSTKNQRAKLCRDGNGGVIVCWSQITFDSAVNMTIYAQIFAQKYDAAGTPAWTANGVQVCTAPGMRKLPQVVTDGAGGIIVFFMDTRYSYQLQPQLQYVEIWDEEFSNLDIYAQKISAAGVLQWTQNGLIIADNAGNQKFPDYSELTTSAVSDSSGGAMIVYKDAPNSPVWRGQYINNEGMRQWPNNGKALADGIGNSIKSDGKKGMLAVKVYYNGGLALGTGFSLIRIQNNGLVQSTINLAAYYYGGITSDEEIGTDGLGNFLAVWKDNGYSVVNARRVDSACTIISPTRGMLGTSGIAPTYTNPQLVQSNPGSAIITLTQKTGPSITEIGILRAAKLDYNLPLPLVLQKFSAINNKGEVLLTWTTASEQNTWSFEVERSVDNVQFTTIGSVASAGNSNQLLNYQLIDKSPLSGINYYRLKMIDKDGKFTYSEIKQIRIVVPDWTVKPLNNPVQNKAWLTFSSTKSQQLEYSLYSATGQQLLSKKLQLVPGSMTIGLDMSSFTGGKYFMKAQAGKETATVQIQKL